MAKGTAKSKTVRWGRFELTEAEIERQISEATRLGEARTNCVPNHWPHRLALIECHGRHEESNPRPKSKVKASRNSGKRSRVRKATAVARA